MIRISEHGQKLGILEVVLIHFNVVDNDYQQKSHVLFTFMPNKQCGKVTTISPRSLTMLNTASTELYSFIYGLQIKLSTLSK